MLCGLPTEAFTLLEAPPTRDHACHAVQHSTPPIVLLLIVSHSVGTSDSYYAEELAPCSSPSIHGQFLLILVSADSHAALRSDSGRAAGLPYSRLKYLTLCTRQHLSIDDMSDEPSPLKLSMRPKLTRIRIDEFRDHGDDIKAGWQKRKEVAKGSVINLLKAARGSVRTTERHNVEEERLGPRPVSRRVRAVSRCASDRAHRVDILIACQEFCASI